jgi:hypothetical protein
MRTHLQARSVVPHAHACRQACSPTADRRRGDTATDDVDDDGNVLLRLR